MASSMQSCLTPFLFLQSAHDEMADMLEQANEIQESLGRSYAVPDEVDEEDLQAGLPMRLYTGKYSHLNRLITLRTRCLSKS